MSPMSFKSEFSFPFDQKQVPEPVGVKTVNIYLVGTYYVPGTVLSTGNTVANNQMLLSRPQCLMSNERDRH